MNSSLVSNYIFKLTGGLSLTYALLGIVLALFSIFSLEHLDTGAIQKSDRIATKLLDSGQFSE